MTVSCRKISLCIPVKQLAVAPNVFEFSLTPDGHDYRGVSSGHTDVLSKITYYILLHGWGIK
jgi:hypothetical protein